MSIFTTEEVNSEQYDWITLRDGGIVLYWRPQILADDLSWLKSRGYRVVEFETAEWKSQSEMHDALKDALAFPDYYGKNLDALDECIQEDLVVPDTGGLVLVLNRYDHFAKALAAEGPAVKAAAEAVLDIFARAIRYHMLFGRRLIILVQSDDAKINFGRLGGVPARWNHQEWLKKNRGL